MLKTSSFTAIAVATLFAAPAYAQDQDDWTGFYAGGQIGYGFQPNDDDETIQFDTNLDGFFDNTVRTSAGADAFSPGFCGGAATTNAPTGGCRDDRDRIEGGAHIGYDMQAGSLVFGLVADYNRTRLRDSVSAFSTTPASYTMTRTLRDLFTIRGRVGIAAGRALIYGTAGVAYGRIRNSFTTTNTANSFTGNDDRENGWGGVAGGGVEFRLGRNFTVGAQYLYRAVDADDYVVRAGPGTAGLTNPFRIVNPNGTDFMRSGERLTSHAVQLTASFRFGGRRAIETQTCWDGSVIPADATCPNRPMAEQPLPPEQPQMQTCWDGSSIAVTQTCPPRPVGPFIIFFDWDEDEITPQAAAILDNAAQAYQTTGGAAVMLAGHADRSGSDEYNVGLSQRRANNTRAYLAGRGVPDGSITTQAFGESRPLVDTADGVREPQNRRVEITFGPGSGW